MNSPLRGRELGSIGGEMAIFNSIFGSICVVRSSCAVLNFFLCDPRGQGRLGHFRRYPYVMTQANPNVSFEVLQTIIVCET